MLEVNIEKIIPVTDARDSLNKIVDEVNSSDEMYVLTVNGKPAGVLVGVHHLEKLTGKSEAELMADAGTGTPAPPFNYEPIAPAAGQTASTPPANLSPASPAQPAAAPAPATDEFDLFADSAAPATPAAAPVSSPAPAPSSSPTAENPDETPITFGASAAQPIPAPAPTDSQFQTPPAAAFGAADNQTQNQDQTGSAGV